MKLKSLIITLFLWSSALTAGLPGSSENIEVVKIDLQGSIHNAACSIDAGSQRQTINMGIASIESMLNNIHVTPFSIRLINCTTLTEHGLNFKITFEGLPDKKEFLQTGSASGIKIQITDAYGSVALPGVGLPERQIDKESMELKFQSRLVANRESVRAGNIRASVRFKMDYF